MATEQKFDVVEEIGVISEMETGWKKEVNLVAWFDNEAKLDIRTWSSDRKRCGKGISLSLDEASKLYEILDEYFNRG